MPRVFLAALAALVTVTQAANTYMTYHWHMYVAADLLARIHIITTDKRCEVEMLRVNTAGSSRSTGPHGPSRTH